ncbi:hypothetical protein [Sulfolobus tengchongensis spindle-shaped virus 3]|nr:hypothetical protein [Sulfolobus tengchongensis spindle-shaped virus 3]
MRLLLLVLTFPAIASSCVLRLSGSIMETI